MTFKFDPSFTPPLQRLAAVLAMAIALAACSRDLPAQSARAAAAQPAPAVAAPESAPAASAATDAVCGRCRTSRSWSTATARRW